MCKLCRETKLINISSGEPYDVSIMRSSKWGNPYTHKTGTRAKYILGTRSEAIEAYREYIMNGEGKSLLNDLHELRGKIISCCCLPSACHGSVLIELIELYCPNTKSIFDF